MRMTFKGAIAGRACDNVEDFSVDPGTGSRSVLLPALATMIMTAWQDDIMDAMGSGYSITGAHWIDLDSLSGGRGDIGPNAGHPTTGQASGSPNVPPNVAFLIHKRCSFTRGQRPGRMFIAPLLEPDVDDTGVISGAAKTRVNAAVTGFRSDVNSISLPLLGSIAWRVVHVTGHELDPPHRPNAWNSSDVTSTDCDNLAATQRRRLR